MTYEPIALGLKFSIKISDLKATGVVIVTCPACNARFSVAPHHLHARYHEYRKLIDIEADFKCRRCDAKGDLRLHIMRAVGPVYPSAV